MSDISEEEYLDKLLKSMNTENVDTDEAEEFLNETEDSTEAEEFSDAAGAEEPLEVYDETVPEENNDEYDEDADTRFLNSILMNDEPTDSEEVLSLNEDESAMPDEEIILSDETDIFSDDEIDPSELFKDDFADILAFSENSTDDSDSEGAAITEENPKKVKTKKAKKEKKNGNSGFKKFLMAFDDGEDVPEKKENVIHEQLLSEAYGDMDDSQKKSSEKEKAEAKKAEKLKKKELKKKEKLKKAELARAERIKNIDLDSMAVISIGRIIRALIIVAVVCIAVIFSSRIFSYNNYLRSSKKMFSVGNYTAAYEKISGLDIKNKDSFYYMQSRIMASLCQGIESYDSNILADNETMAVSALVKAVSRKNELQEQIEKYEVASQAETVYRRILNILDGYGISEEDALELNSLTDYGEYIGKINSYGGNRK